MVGRWICIRFLYSGKMHFKLYFKPMAKTSDFLLIENEK